jgi:hypothetical protein
MLMQPNNLEILLCTAPTDMRKSINGLCFLVDGDLGENPSCGTVYIFCNRVKISLRFCIGMAMDFACSISVLKKAVLRSLRKLTLYPSALMSFAGYCKESTSSRCRNQRFFQSKLMRKSLSQTLCLLTLRLVFGKFNHEPDS